MVLLQPVEFLADRDIENAALELLVQHRERTQVDVHLPVPIEDIIERTLELRVVWLEIEEQPDEVILARLDPSYEGLPTVQMNDLRLKGHFEQYFGTEQFSMAHEAGHWILHYLRGQSGVGQLALFGDEQERPDPVLCRHLSGGDRRELQADRFAANLLLPAHLLDEVTRGRDLSRWQVIADLAHNCGVSKRAFTRRLEELGRMPKLGHSRLW